VDYCSPFPPNNTPSQWQAPETNKNTTRAALLLNHHHHHHPRVLKPRRRTRAHSTSAGSSKSFSQNSQNSLTNHPRNHMLAYQYNERPDRSLTHFFRSCRTWKKRETTTSLCFLLKPRHKHHAAFAHAAGPLKPILNVKKSTIFLPHFISIVPCLERKYRRRSRAANISLLSTVRFFKAKLFGTRTI
jgi:hypothetical protein